MDLSVHLVDVALLGGFESAYRGNRVSLPLGSQRLLAFLALQDGGAHRVAAAERLWPDSSPARAAASLRSALWRGRRIADITLIECVGPRLRLSPAVRVDLHMLLCQARRILRDPCLVANNNHEVLVDGLSRDLLPAWAEDWLVVERELWDQMRLHTLEILAQQLYSSAQYLRALQTALAAVAIEPIRETAHRIIIEIHMAEGNAGSALKHYQRYRALLQRELGVAPSPRMAELASALLPS